MKKKLYLNYMYFSVILFGLLLLAGCTKKDEEGKVPVTTSSDEAKADFLKGRDLFEKLRTRESLQPFENAIAKDTAFALAYYNHAIGNPTTKGFFEDLEKAVALADKVSEGEKLMILALKAGADGDTKLQEEYLTQLVAKYPNDERAQSLIGQFYFGQQMYDKAIDHLKKSTEIAPNYSLSYNMLGYSYKNKESYQDAENAFKKYIELIPNDPNPYDSFAELLMKEGKYEESISQYRKALATNPDFAASYLGISNNYNYLNKYEDARNELKKLHDKAKDDGEKRAALFAMTVSYSDEGKYDSAMEEMQKQYELGKAINDAGAMSGDLNTMGNILYESGKYDEAKKKYEESLQTTLSSKLSSAIKENAKRINLYNTARIYLAKENLPAAKEKSKEFSEKANAAKNTFQIWLSHELDGLIALQEKDYKKAESEFNLANQQNPYTFYYLGLAYQGLNDNEMAKKKFNEAANYNSLNNLNQSFVRNKTRKIISS